jgi:hypothetical protein
MTNLMWFATPGVTTALEVSTVVMPFMLQAFHKAVPAVSLSTK